MLRGRGWRVVVENGEIQPLEPAAANPGTLVELGGLFRRTPARLKFLRSDATESLRVREAFQSLALAHPRTAFSLEEGGRRPLQAPACLSEDDGAALAERVRQVLGAGFAESARAVRAETSELGLQGLAALPTYRQSGSGRCFFFINRRPRARPPAPRGSAGRLRRPCAARELPPPLCSSFSLPYEAVDVNVHPAKAEVRFQDPSAVRALVISALRRMLESEAGRTSATLSEQLEARLAAPALAAASGGAMGASGGAPGGRASHGEPQGGLQRGSAPLRHSWGRLGRDAALCASARLLAPLTGPGPGVRPSGAGAGGPRTPLGLDTPPAGPQPRCRGAGRVGASGGVGGLPPRCGHRPDPQDLHRLPDPRQPHHHRPTRCR